ncbi:hypothetical protein [Halosimplex amylolyticum]|uniref:hypothetical protein n=1 Tax=Halosimplex amylolyticum TaxID=3396616 RepID=UPI003F54C39E
MTETRGSSALRWTLLAGLAFSLSAAGALLAVSAAPPRSGPPDAEVLRIVSLGAGGAGALCWLAIVERSRRWRPSRRAALAGALAGFLGPAGATALAALFGEVGPPAERAGVALFVGLTTVGAVGWWAPPVGAATGYLLGRRRDSSDDAGPGVA